MESILFAHAGLRQASFASINKPISLIRALWRSLVSAVMAGVVVIAVFTFKTNVEFSMVVNARFEMHGVAGVRVGTVGDSHSCNDSRIELRDSLDLI